MALTVKSMSGVGNGDMSFRDMTVVQLLQGVSLPAAVAVLIWVHNYYLGLIHASVVGVEVRMIERSIDDFEERAALYEARLQDDGSLSPSDGNRYTIILGKIQEAKEDITRLEDSL